MSESGGLNKIQTESYEKGPPLPSTGPFAWQPDKLEVFAHGPVGHMYCYRFDPTGKEKPLYRRIDMAYEIDEMDDDKKEVSGDE